MYHKRDFAQADLSFFKGFLFFLQDFFKISRFSDERSPETAQIRSRSRSSGPMMSPSSSSGAVMYQ